MPSERIQRRIDQYLVDAEAASRVTVGNDTRSSIRAAQVVLTVVPRLSGSGSRESHGTPAGCSIETLRVEARLDVYTASLVSVCEERRL